MNPDDVPEGFPRGVSLVPVYQHVPCEESTGPLAEYMAQHTGHMGTTSRDLEVLILRWLVDNGMALVKRN